MVCRRIEDVNALLADLQATRAIQSSRTAFVLETLVEQGRLRRPSTGRWSRGGLRHVHAPAYAALLPWIALFVIYVVWGSTYLAIAIVVREVPPFAAALLRFLIAGLVMAAAWPRRRSAGHGRPTAPAAGSTTP